MARRKKIDLNNSSFFDMAEQMMNPGVAPQTENPINKNVASTTTMPNNVGNGLRPTQRVEQSPMSNNLESCVGLSINIGRRSYQQDAILTSNPNPGENLPSRWLAVLCDGMGGMNGGEKASSLSVKITLERFNELTHWNIPSFYNGLIDEIDERVNTLEDENGSLLGSGTTFISVLFHEGKLWWASVGDSHIYIIRGNQIKMVVKEHNYLQDLLEMVSKNELTIEEAYADKSKDALTSFIGMGGVLHKDINALPAQLEKGDIIMLCSDGLYRSVSDVEIVQIVQNYSENMSVAAEKLVQHAIMKNNPYQDNTSVILARY